MNSSANPLDIHNNCFRTWPLAYLELPHNLLDMDTLSKMDGK